MAPHRSGRPGRSTLRGLGAVAATLGAGYIAERATVARWRRGSDPCRDEPQVVAGIDRQIEVADGTELHVVVSEPAGPVHDGAGTVVLAHGYTATSHHWAPVADRLVAAGLRVVVFDQRGHGRSSSGDGRVGTDQLAADLAAVVDALRADTTGNGDGRIIVAGHSMGGIGAQAALTARPDLAAPAGPVAGLVLVSTLTRSVSTPLGRLMNRMGGTALARRAMAHRVHGRILARGGLGARPALSIIDVVRHGWATCPDTTRAGVMRDLRGYDFSDTLRDLEVPVTVLSGDRDQVTPLDESRRMVELLPQGRLEVVPGCGHALPWEAADRVADAIAAQARGRARGCDEVEADRVARFDGLDL